MDALERVDLALDKILKASGSALRNYTLPATLQNMRAAMRDVMSESYIQGSNDHAKAYAAAQDRLRGCQPTPSAKPRKPPPRHQ